MTSVLDKIADRQQAIEKAKADQWRKIVADIADGKEPDVETVEKVMTEAGKTLRDLNNEVAQRRRIKELRQTIGRINAEEATRPQLLEEIRRVNEVFEAARQTHVQAIGPLQWKMEQLSANGVTYQSAKAELRKLTDDYGDPEKEYERQRLSEARSTLMALVSDIKVSLRTAEGRVTKGGTHKKDYEADLERIKARLAEAEKALAENIARDSQLENEIREAEERFITG